MIPHTKVHCPNHVCVYVYDKVSFSPLISSLTNKVSGSNTMSLLFVESNLMQIDTLIWDTWDTKFGIHGIQNYDVEVLVL